MDGKGWKRVHFSGIIFFTAMWIFAWITGLVNSVAFVSHVSMVALILSEITSWQASRTEQKEDDRGK